MLHLLFLMLAAFIGFAIHRASICSVKAVAEIFSTGRAHLLFSFIKMAVWVVAVTLLIKTFWPHSQAPGHGWQLTILALQGGFVFGLGAALNQGCAFSTLGRLGTGQIRMVLTLVGIGLGTLIVDSTGLELAGTSLTPVAPAYDEVTPAIVLWLIVLGAWGFWEIARLWRTRPVHLGWSKLILTPAYRLSTAAAIIGLSNGVLYAFHGHWAYTSTIEGAARWILAADVASSSTQWMLFAAVLLGVFVSAWQRRVFHLDWRMRPSWFLNLAGGVLMGVGAVITPGGNDVLLLHSIPGLSPHAVPAYIAMMLGISVVFGMMRLMTGMQMRVNCRGDVCKEER